MFMLTFIFGYLLYTIFTFLFSPRKKTQPENAGKDKKE